MDKESNGTYIYHISTNPKHQKGDLFSMDEQAENKSVFFSSGQNSHALFSLVSSVWHQLLG